ncbi:hypothetical protein DEO23_10080 [Brachybacterium endophyticum]|uniref:Bacterial sugar transferase domain-containing protein n=2 Tax=Brachybacterium endophyticum TaxID=2182385 RepID=A0A2U2RK37_9MICO|nr:hypothetical protein DEO23_10080 [Brachybacterium endophyticum]
MKRLADALVAGTALLALSPLLLTIAGLVRLRLGAGGIFFHQRRLGLDGEVFEALKFRTMRPPDAARGLLSDEARLTPFGRRLRSTSLDELPGLLNVVRGDMSLVGPRPLLPEYLERYSEDQTYRLDVLPGLTGLAQVSGRNTLSWDDRFDLDLEYIRMRGPLLDLRILMATVPKVLRSEGISEQGHVTNSVFFGPRRIGEHAIRPVADAGELRFEIVHRPSGTAVAECSLVRTGETTADLGIDVLPGAADPELIRARAAEMMLGIARAHAVETVQYESTGSSVPSQLPPRLGFLRVAVDGRAIDVRTLGKVER